MPDFESIIEKERGRLSQMASSLARHDGLIEERQVPMKAGRDQSADEVVLTGRTITQAQYVARGLQIVRENLENRM